MSPQNEQATHRLKAIKYAENHSVVETCQKYNIDRTSFYKFKKRFQQDGFEGLKNKSHRHHSYQQKVTSEIETEILDIAIHNPKIGSRKISNKLKEKGIILNFNTINRILQKNKCSTRIIRLYISSLINKDVSLKNKLLLEIFNKDSSKDEIYFSLNPKEKRQFKTNYIDTKEKQLKRKYKPLLSRLDYEW